jgi:hypothetical protein
VIEVDDLPAILTSLRLHWGHEKPKVLDVAVTALGNAPSLMADRSLREMQRTHRARLLR